MQPSSTTRLCRIHVRPLSYGSVEETLSFNHPFLPLTEADHCRFNVRSMAVRSRAKRELDDLRECLHMGEVLQKREIENVMRATADTDQINARLRSKLDKLPRYYDSILANLKQRTDHQEKVEYLQGLNLILEEGEVTEIEITNIREEVFQLNNRSGHIQQLLVAQREEIDHLTLKVSELKGIKKKVSEKRSCATKVNPVTVVVAFTAPSIVAAVVRKWRSKATSLILILILILEGGI